MHARLFDQRADIPLKMLRDCGRIGGYQRHGAVGIQSDNVCQRALCVSQGAVGGDAVQCGLRIGGLRLQLVGGCCAADFVACFGGIKTFLCCPFGFHSRIQRGRTGLYLVIILHRGEKYRLHGTVLCRDCGSEQLAGIFHAGGARAEVIQQIGKSHANVALLRTGNSGSSGAGIGRVQTDSGQVSRLAHADLCSLHLRIGPCHTSLRVIAQGEVDDFLQVERMVKGLRSARITGCTVDSQRRQGRQHRIGAERIGRFSGKGLAA